MSVMRTDLAVAFFVPCRMCVTSLPAVGLCAAHSLQLPVTTIQEGVTAGGDFDVQLARGERTTTTLNKPEEVSKTGNLLFSFSTSPTTLRRMIPTVFRLGFDIDQQD